MELALDRLYLPSTASAYSQEEKYFPVSQLKDPYLLIPFDSTREVLGEKFAAVFGTGEVQLLLLLSGGCQSISVLPLVSKSTSTSGLQICHEMACSEVS